MKIKTTLQFHILFLMALSTSMVARADFTHEKCAHVLTSSGEIQINRQWDQDARICILDIHPRNVENLQYRDFYFDNLGHFMVFNSYGDGPDTQMTGAREFFIFPIIEDYPDFSIEKNGNVIVKLVSGHLFEISAKDFSIVSLTPGTITEKALSPRNQGGVELSLTAGFWIDGGFKKGGSRMGNPKLTSTIKSAKSAKSCSLLNSAFLSYQAEGNFVFKYEKESLVSFLKAKCNGLQF